MQELPAAAKKASPSKAAVYSAQLLRIPLDEELGFVVGRSCRQQEGVGQKQAKLIQAGFQKPPRRFLEGRMLVKPRTHPYQACARSFANVDTKL